MSNLKKPPVKVIDGLVLFLESILNKTKVRTESTSNLTSIVFPELKIPKELWEIRAEFYDRGYLFFYSEVVEKEKVYTFFNLTKML